MRPTTFVLGAGASCDFDLPVGTQLRDAIINLLAEQLPEEEPPHRTAIMAACAQIPLGWGEAKDASDRIRRGLYYSNSIDDFLYENRKDRAVVELGRIAIAQCMLNAERSSHRHVALDSGTVDGRRDATNWLSNSSWVGSLFRQLKRGLTAEEADRALRNCSFVVFNYDRCLEQFLYWAFHDAFGIGPGEARELLSQVPIHHVYGSLGNLPVMEKGSAVAFGDHGLADLHLVASRIKTYTEGLHDEELNLIREQMESAEQVIFLGYAFHPQGLEILFPNGARPDQRVGGTLWGLNQEAQARAYGLAGKAGQRFSPNNRCLEYVTLEGPTFIAY